MEHLDMVPLRSRYILVGYTVGFSGQEGQRYPALPEPMGNARPARQFRVVGEEDEWL